MAPNGPFDLCWAMLLCWPVSSPPCDCGSVPLAIRKNESCSPICPDSNGQFPTGSLHAVSHEEESLDEEEQVIEPEDVPYGKCRWDFFLSHLFYGLQRSMHFPLAAVEHFPLQTDSLALKLAQLKHSQVGVCLPIKYVYYSIYRYKYIT